MDMEVTALRGKLRRFPHGTEYVSALSHVILTLCIAGMNGAMFLKLVRSATPAKNTQTITIVMKHVNLEYQNYSFYCPIHIEAIIQIA